MSSLPALTMADLEAMDEDDLRDRIKKLRALKAKAQDEGPQNDDELHAWVIENIGVNLSRVKVCDDHDAPFTFFADLYFERTQSALLMANRGGGKTFLVALLHYINSIYKPGCESLSFGATEAQSKRCYQHLTNWTTEVKTNPDGTKHSVLKNFLVRSIEKLTEFKNGSRVEIVPGTKKAVNGPHPQKAHADEVEQIDDEAWEESRNMAVSKTVKTDEFDPETGEPILRVIKAQDIMTSTRKTARGRMQQLMDQAANAKREGLKPPFEVYKFCVWETTQRQPNCRSAPENAERLAAGDPTLCDCDTVAAPGYDKAKDAEGKEVLVRRTFDKACGGKLYRSGGHHPLEQVHNTFQQNSPRTWAAQQECSRPLTEGNYLDWDESFHEIYGYAPDPANGPIYMGVDWGGTNPHAVGWFQRLTTRVVVKDSEGHPRVLPDESIVLFDEIYKAEISARQLGERVKEREAWWKKQYPNFKVKARFTDPQGKPHRIEFKNQGLKSSWPVKTRNWDFITDELVDVFDAGHFFASAERCRNFIAEAGEWKKNPKTGEQIDEFNHMIDAARYAVANINKDSNRKDRLAKGKANSGARRSEEADDGKKRRGPVGFIGGRRRHPLDEFRN